MIVGLFASGLMGLAISLGLAWPWAERLLLGPAEKLVASAALSLLVVFAVAWTVYIFDLPTTLLWIIPAVATGSLAIRGRSLVRTLENTDAQNLIVAQALVSGWSVGCLALIVHYSGGKAVGDWFGHWQRAQFFLYHWPQDILFNGFDPLPSRPPLANVVTGVFLRVTKVDFAHYQLFSTLLSSLAFSPAALLARRFQPQQAGDRAIAPKRTTHILAVLFMLSPLFVQNATYAWTKLPTAFFAFTALYFFLRIKDSDAPQSASWLFGSTLAGALLTHYSAGPYAVMLAAAWLTAAWISFRSAEWWRATALAVASGALVLAMWFGWAIATYGPRGTFLSNTTVTDQAPTAAAQFKIIALNFRDTLIPHFLRGSDLHEFAQTSPWGWWRDWFFQLYQDNLWFAFGSVGVTAIFVVLWARRHDIPRRDTAFWGFFVAGVVVLGVATHGGRENSGLAYVSLQPLVLLGLTFLAAQWTSLGPRWRLAVVAGTSIDFMLGIVLQLGTENHAFDRWFAPGRDFASTLSSYSLFAQINSRVKGDAGWIFVGDIFSASRALVLAALAAILLLALIRAAHSNPDSR